jgi:Dullard-like phosphatase family protein
MGAKRPARAARRSPPRPSVPSAHPGSGLDADAPPPKKRSKLLTGNFYSPNLERSKFKTFVSEPMIHKEASYRFQEKLEKYAGQEARPAPPAPGQKPDQPPGADSPAPKAGQEVWTGTCTLAPNQKICSSSRLTLSTNAQTPVLDKLCPEGYWAQKNPTTPNLGAHDHSYLKKLKPALLEQPPAPDAQDQPKPKQKPRDTPDLLSLKKLKGIASAKNMFINGGLVHTKNQIMLSLQNKDKNNKSGLASSPRTPLLDKCPNLEAPDAAASRSALSPLLQKEKRQENDLSSISTTTKEKSAQKHTAASSPNTPFTATSAKGQPAEEDKARREPQAEEAHLIYYSVKLEYLKPSRMQSLAQTQEAVNQVHNLISQEKDPYELIRSYSDLSQDPQFNELEVASAHQNLFKVKVARLLFSRLLKLERMLVVYLFYFTIQDADQDKFKLLMLELSELLYKNMSFVVSWLFRLPEFNRKSLEKLFKNVSPQVAVAQAKDQAFFEQLLANSQEVISKLSSVSKSLKKSTSQLFAQFVENIDRWSVNKAFEFGFECFYETFIEKGVISVSTQDKENQQADENRDALKDTPRKAANPLRQVDCMQTERKSFGDRLIIQELKELEGFQKAVEQMKASQRIDSPIFLFQPDTHKVKLKRPLLPDIRSDREYTLVLDLDETLIHFEENSDGTSQFLLRPYAQNFIKEVSKYFEVVIFTAALKDYADYILDRLDTEKSVTHRLYRNNCTFSDNVYQKDLTKLGRDLAKTIIVDNNAENFQLQPENGIYIKSWYNDPTCEALQRLAPLLIGTLG